MEQNKFNIKFITRAGIVAAIYCVLTLILEPVSFGIFQFRLSEALTILPFFMPGAIPGLFVGCILANYIGGLGPIDVIFGSLTTLAAAYITYKMPNKYFAVLPPIILNAVIISIWLCKIFAWPYYLTVLSLGISEAATAGIGGIILAYALEKVPKKYIS